MNQRKKRIGIALTLIVLAAVAVASLLAFAESSSQASAASAATATTTSFLAKVAKNLGIEESKLDAAIQTAQEQSVDEALAAGRITEEQAAAMRDRLAAEKAMRDLITEGVASGKITENQAQLLGSRGLGMGMMSDLGLGRVGQTAGRSFGDAQQMGGPCDGRMGRGLGL